MNSYSFNQKQVDNSLSEPQIEDITFKTIKLHPILVIFFVEFRSQHHGARLLGQARLFERIRYIFCVNDLKARYSLFLPHWCLQINTKQT